MECTLYLSDNCNLQCKYCYERKNRIQSNLSEKNLQLAIEYIANNTRIGDRIDLLFLGGEPLLNKNMMYRAIEIIHDKYFEYQPYFFYHITTNGILIEEEDITFFKKNNFEVSISIDGDHETHSLNRLSVSGNDEYDVIIENMKKMQKADLNLVVRMTATLNNVRFLYNNARYFFDMGIKHINIGIDELGRWTEAELEIFDKQLELLDQYYLNEVIKDDEKILNIYDYRLASFVFLREPKFCSAGTKSHIVINSKGEFYPCGYVANDECWKIGNLDKGLNTKKFYETVRANACKESSCKDCEIAYTCCGAKCGFLNYALTGRLNLHSDITCKLQKMIYKHNVLVLKKMYKTRNRRIMKMIESAKQYNIELGPIMKELLKECNV